MIPKIIIGISGASGAGKTFLAHKLCEKFHKKTALFSLDNYYLPRNLQPIDENGEHNFDTLNSMDLEQYHSDLTAIKNGYEVRQKIYNFNNPLLKETEVRYHTLKPAEIIVVEGIFTFFQEQIRSSFDFKILVDSEEELRYTRRVHRDLVERGYDEADVKYKFENHLKKADELYIKPMLSVADVIFENNGVTFDNEFEKLIKRINSVMAYKLSR